jgi:hypothetical protein
MDSIGIEDMGIEDMLKLLWLGLLYCVFVAVPEKVGVAFMGVPFVLCAARAGATQTQRAIRTSSAQCLYSCPPENPEKDTAILEVEQLEN